MEDAPLSWKGHALITSRDYGTIKNAFGFSDAIRDLSMPRSVKLVLRTCTMPRAACAADKCKIY